MQTAPLTSERPAQKNATMFIRWNTLMPTGMVMLLALLNGGCGRHCLRRQLPPDSIIGFSATNNSLVLPARQPALQQSFTDFPPIPAPMSKEDMEKRIIALEVARERIDKSIEDIRKTMQKPAATPRSG